MGHDCEIIENLPGLGLGPGSIVADLGSQDFAASQISAVNRSVKKLFGAAPFPEGQIVPASTVFRSIGLDYTCYDVDQRPGSIYLDLSSFQFPVDHYGRYDAVFNAGTSEHLVSPLGLLFFMHHATKVGGLMWHKVPMYGWGNHGLSNLTPKFWHQLATYNDYEVVEAACVPTDTSVAGVGGNFYGSHLDFIRGLKDFPSASALGLMVFRKKHNFCFIPPFDIEDPTPNANTEHLMRSALAPFQATGSLSVREINRAMNWHFGRADPDSIVWEGSELTFQDACDRAEQLAIEGRRGKAISIYESIIRVNPEHADAMFRLGHLRAKYDIRVAFELMQRAIRLAPDNAGYVRSCEELLRLKRHACFEGDVVTIQALYDQAEEAIDAGETARAVSMLEKIVADFPDHGVASKRLASILHPDGNAGSRETADGVAGLPETGVRFAKRVLRRILERVQVHL